MIQLQVLNAILERKNASLILENRLSEDFFSEYPKEFKYILDHINKYGEVPDKLSFLEAFPNFDIIEVYEDDNYLLTQLGEDRAKRILAQTFTQVRDLINSGKTSEALAIYTNSIEKINNTRKIRCVDIIKDTSRYSRYLENVTSFNKYFIPTGFLELDEIIGGWDAREELATIVARPNIGKSWVLLKAAIAAAKTGRTVGIYSGEMSEYKVGFRLDTLISHISNTKIIHGNDSIQLEYKRYLEELAKQITGSIKVLTPSMIGGAAGVNALRAFIEKENLEVLYVDQHSLLEDDRGARNPVERAANISRDLKNLQVLKGIPIISVSQQNRETSEDGKPSTRFIAQSDRIGQDSTVVLFLEQEHFLPL